MAWEELGFKWLGITSKALEAMKLITSTAFDWSNNWRSSGVKCFSWTSTAVLRFKLAARNAERSWRALSVDDRVVGISMQTSMAASASAQKEVLNWVTIMVQIGSFPPMLPNPKAVNKATFFHRKTRSTSGLFNSHIIRGVRPPEGRSRSVTWPTSTRTTTYSTPGGVWVRPPIPLLLAALSTITPSQGLRNMSRVLVMLPFLGGWEPQQKHPKTHYPPNLEPPFENPNLHGHPVPIQPKWFPVPWRVEAVPSNTFKSRRPLTHHAVEPCFLVPSVERCSSMANSRDGPMKEPPLELRCPLTCWRQI